MFYQKLDKKLIDIVFEHKTFISAFPIWQKITEIVDNVDWMSLDFSCFIAFANNNETRSLGENNDLVIMILE